MIISASRRTDIPSYYSDWFVNRLKDGYVLIQNPRNRDRYSKAILTREAVDCIVFWTKNPKPMIAKLHAIDEMGYPYYFQFTLTPYDRSIEKRLPNKRELLQTFQKLSSQIGTHRIVWRYDPVIINDILTVDYHIKAFGKMAKILNGYTNRCIISFVDSYKNISTRMGFEPQYQMTESNIQLIVQNFSQIAKKNNMRIFTCAEDREFSEYGIEHSSCIDKGMIENILGVKINVTKDKNQRPACGCVESIDIGTYDCCANGCNYCYATTSEKIVKKNINLHNPLAPVLIGKVNQNAIITERDSKSVIIDQITLF